MLNDAELEIGGQMFQELEKFKDQGILLTLASSYGGNHKIKPIATFLMPIDAELKIKGQVFQGFGNFETRGGVLTLRSSYRRNLKTQPI